jgi:hypothetical protein
MRFYAQGALLFLLLGLGATRAASGQQKRAGWDGAQRVTATATTATSKDRGQQPKTFSSRSLTPSEGLAILGVALETRHHASFPSDCSHLVHELYRRAGFPYQYASSSDLYAGIDEFRRVASPQREIWRYGADMLGLWSIPLSTPFSARSVRAVASIPTTRLIGDSGGSPASFATSSWLPVASSPRRIGLLV